MKKFLSLIMVFAIFLCTLPFATITTSAMTSEYYTYTVSNGEATITDCNTSISGDVTIPSTLGGYPVTSIGNSAFENCSLMTSLTIPNSVTRIDYDAFFLCSSLTKVNITDLAAWCNIHFYSWEGSYYSNPLYYAKKLYINGTLATNITIPNSVTSISDAAFYYCNSLKSVTIPDNVTSIGWKTFYNCSSLAYVTLSDNITYIGYHAFSGTEYSQNSSNWEYDVLYIGNHLIEAKKSLSGEYVIKENTKTITDWAFSYCSSMTSVLIPNSVTIIGYSAFSDCSSLEKVYYTGSIKQWEDINIYDDNYILLSAEIIFNYKETPDLPYDNVTDYLFYEISNNEAVITGCDSRISGDVIIPSMLGGYTVASISNTAFYNCSSMTSVLIPNSVTTIGDSAFYNCSSLTKVSIGKGVTSIGDSAFYGCFSIDNVFFLGSAVKLAIILQPNNTCLSNAKAIYYHNYHQYNEWTVAIEPTCIDMGGKYHTCITCGEAENELILPTGEHIYENGKCIYCGIIAENEQNFKSDLNGDGEINSADVVIMKRAVLGTNELIAEDVMAYDINEDGITNILDLIALKKIIAK